MPEQVKKTFVPLLYFALAVSALLVFQQVRNFDFVNFDDNVYVYENPHVLNGLTYDGIKWAFTTGHASNWHPITWLSLMLDCQLFGPNPGRIHLVNLLLHIANTLLLFAVLKKITGSLWPSAFVAAAFALHPMHVESVAWITERKDVLSTLFCMLTLAAYAAYVIRHSLFYYLLAVLLFALGLLAKPILVTLPFLLLLLDYWPLERLGSVSIFKLVLEKIPFFVLSAVSSVVTFLVQQAGFMPDIHTLHLNTRITNALLSYTAYLGKIFWPQNLAIYYPLHIGGIPFWQIASCAFLLLAVSVLVIHFGRRHRYLPTGWFWFVGTLVPVIGLVQVGGQAYADRYTYIPYIGLFIMIAWGLPELLSKLPYRKFVLGISAVIALTAMGICARQQVSYWNNGTTLFSHALDVTQNNEVAHNNLGLAYCKVGRWQEAIENFNHAIKIDPNYTQAFNNLGFTCYSLGRYQDAIKYLSKAIKINPDLAEAHNSLGAVYGSLGSFQDAIEAYKQALRIKPDYAEAYNNLGAVYGVLGRRQEAIENFRQAIKIKPNYADAHNNLGLVYSKLGCFQDAIDAHKQAIKIKPDFARAHYNLGSAYLLTGDKGSALQEYKILKTLDTEQANKLFNLINK